MQNSYCDHRNQALKQRFIVNSFIVNFIVNLLTSIFTYLVDSNKNIYIFRAMDAVRYYSAEQLGDMTKHDISHLVGDKEGRKLYTQLTIEKSGDCWHVRNVYSFSR